MHRWLKKYLLPLASEGICIDVLVVIYFPPIGDVMIPECYVKLHQVTV